MAFALLVLAADAVALAVILGTLFVMASRAIRYAFRTKIKADWL
jgi:hypothetical protein